MLLQPILVHFGWNLTQDQQIQQSSHRSMNIWSLHHKNVASNDQAHQELSRDMLFLVVVFNAVMHHQIIW